MAMMSAYIVQACSEPAHRQADFTDLSYDVISAYLAERVTDSPVPVVVSDSTIPVPDRQRDREQWEQWVEYWATGYEQSAELQSIPRGLYDLFVNAQGRFGLNAARFDVSQGVTLLDAQGRGTIRSMADSSYWGAFRTVFPGAPGRFSFSPVFFDADASEALFYVDYGCGGTCGSGALVHLTREGEGWEVETTVVTVVN